MQFNKDLSQYRPRFVAAGEATAGGTGDATKVNGVDIDRTNFLCGKLLITFSAELAEGKTLSFAIEHEDSQDGSTRGTAVVDQASTIAATGGAGGTTETGVVEMDMDLSSAMLFRRYNVTPDLSASSVDTCFWTAALVLGGALQLPAV